MIDTSPRLFRAGKVNCLNARCFHFAAKDN